MTEPLMNRHPSLEEFGGWYNLGYERPDGIPVLHSQSHIPEFEHGEFFHIWMEEHAWFETLVPRSAIKPYDPIAEPPMYVKSDADDRTLDVFANPDYLTLDVIKRIQREFLGRHPFWRVVLVADHPSCSIVIYPDAIRFGSWPLTSNADDAFCDVNVRALTLRDARERPMRERFEFLQRRLPDVIHSIGNRAFAVAGILETTIGDRHWNVLFLAVRGPNCRLFEVRLQKSDNQDQRASTSSGFSVDRSGQFIDDESNPDDIAFSIRLWYLPADYRGPLTIVNRDTGEQYPYEVKSEDITRLGPQA